MNNLKRNRIAVLLVLFVILSPSSYANSAVSADAMQEFTWKDKLKRGSLNIVTSPVEVARQIHLTTDEKNLLNGWTIGLVKGLGEGFIRFGAGVIDFVTFPFNFPDKRKGPLVQPEYVWEKPGLKYT